MLDVLPGVPRLFSRAGSGFCFLGATSPASWALVLSLPTLRSQLSVLGLLLWGWGSCGAQAGSGGSSSEIKAAQAAGEGPQGGILPLQ